MRWQIACLTLALAGIAWTAVGEEPPTTECRPELLAPVNVLDAEKEGPCCRQAMAACAKSSNGEPVIEEPVVDAEWEQEQERLKGLALFNDMKFGEPAQQRHQRILQLLTEHKLKSDEASRPRLFSQESLQTHDDAAGDYALLPAKGFAEEPVSIEAKVGFAQMLRVEPPAKEAQPKWQNAKRDWFEGMTFTVPIGL